MKKLLLFLLIFIVLIAGCNDGGNSRLSEKPDIDVNGTPVALNPDEIPIPIETDGQLPEFFDSVSLLSIYQPASNKAVKYYNLMNWQEYIKQKFDIDIQMVHDSKELRGAQAVYYYNYRIGYPFINVTQLFDYNKTGMAHNLAPYYEKYDWYQYVDSSYIREMTVDGEIYAIPTAPNKYILPRYYNAEYLDKLGMEVPTDINSFLDYLNESKKIMSGEGILLPMFVSNHMIYPSTADIFRAYGAYVNSEYNSAQSYNPQTQSFEDAVFSKNIVNALEFIKMLQSQELMGIFGEADFYDSNKMSSGNQFMGDRFKVNNNLATDYNLIFDNEIKYFMKSLLTEPSYEARSGYYLTHTNSEKVCEIRSDMGFYIFPENIKNINGVIELFNSILTDNDYYADLLYGVENTEYVMVGEDIVPEVPAIGTFPGIRLLKPVEDKYNYYSEGNISAINSIPENMFFESNIFNQMTRYRYISGNMTHRGSFNDKLFMKDFPTEDAIKEYKEWFINSGRREMINQLNEKINAVTAYDYN